MTAQRTPKRFAGLHNHTSHSAYDGLGYPDDHFKWCMENGLDAHAITEHGHMNSYAHAQIWIEKWNKEHADNPFLYIPGVEAYFHPDLQQWVRDKDEHEAAAKDKKLADKLRRSQQEKLQTKLIEHTDASDETEDIETSNALTIEDEDASKTSTKQFNPVNRRHHLLILPKNQRGLLAVFSAISKSYMEGFYRFPRIDLSTVREMGKNGDVIMSSACLGGHVSWAIFQELQKVRFDDLDQRLLDDACLLNKCVNAVGDVYDMMTDAIGRENYFLELQFNRLPAQNLVNRAILEFAKRNGLNEQLIVTGDAHYYRPELWKEREIYKRLGFMGSKGIDPTTLPKSRDDLKCELYPKNAAQTWEEYGRSKRGTSFYDDDVIVDAIERTYHIAHDVIGAIPPDRSPKFPNDRLVPHDTTSFKHLVRLCKAGMESRGIADKPDYIARMKEELNVIKTLKNADYFVSYQKIMELAHKSVLCGPGRGCFVPTTRVLMNNGKFKCIADIRAGEWVIDYFGTAREVMETFVYDVSEDLLTLTFDSGDIITCTAQHRFKTHNRGFVAASQLTDDDLIVDVRDPHRAVSMVTRTPFAYRGKVHDLNVRVTHAYNVEGLAVHNSGGGSLVAYALHIHDMDPLRWDLPFSRFLSVYRCLLPSTYVKTPLSHVQLSDIQIGDEVVADDGSTQVVTDKHISRASRTYKICVNGVELECSPDHVWIVKGANGQRIEKRTDELMLDDELYATHESGKFISSMKIEKVEICDHNDEIELIDIRVSNRHKFWVSDVGLTWILTHNCGSPDIDCVYASHLILMANGNYKHADEIVPCDEVLGGDNLPHVIESVVVRHRRFDERIYSVRVKAEDGTIGHLIVVPRHKFLRDTGEAVLCCDLDVGDALLAPCRVTVIEVVDVTDEVPEASQMFVDITVADDHRFNIVPFDSIVDDVTGAVTHTLGYGE